MVSNGIRQYYSMQFLCFLQQHCQKFLYVALKNIAHLLEIFFQDIDLKQTSVLLILHRQQQSRCNPSYKLSLDAAIRYTFKQIKQLVIISSIDHQRDEKTVSVQSDEFLYFAILSICSFTEGNSCGLNVQGQASSDFITLSQ